MSKIACVGIAVQDRIYYLDQLPMTSGKYVANQYREMGGGPAATAAVAASRLGAEVDFIGRVGSDDCGDAIIAELEYYGVNCRYTQRIPGARSSQSAILVDAQGERTIINAASPELPNNADWLHEIDFSAYDLVLADVRWDEGAQLAFTLAAKAGVPTLLDADVTPRIFCRWSH
nr:PfkB family carbohydrate kinase [Dongshaea marina]